MTLLICDKCQIGVALLAILSDYQSVILVVVLQECFRIVIAVYVDLGQGIVDGLLLVACGQALLQEWQQQLKTVTRLDFADKLLSGNAGSFDGVQEALDDVLVTVNIEKSADDARSPCWVDTLYIDLDGLKLLVLVEVEHQIMNKVESIADNDERELFGKLSLFQEVLDLLRVIRV